ncbi:Legume-like lectin family, partial [Rhizoctonia solani]
MWTGLNLAATLILLAAAGTNAQQKARKNHTIEQTVPLRTHSIYAPYVDQDLQNRWFSFGGNAYVNTNKHIRLTRDKPSQAGWLWSRLPLTASSYEIIIEFKASLTWDQWLMAINTLIAGQRFIITSLRRRIRNMVNRHTRRNWPNKFVGLGIFIDTYANSRHTYAFPRIMGMLGDGKTVYDVGNDGASNELAACSANVRKTDIATKLKLIYFKDEYLNVQLHYKGWDEWTECFTVYDVSLPNTPYLGFTAHTGDISDNHDIISVSTSSAILADAPINMPTKKSGSSSGFWTFLSFLVKLAGVSLVGVAALAGYRAYARNAKRRGGFGGLGGGMPQWDNKHF